MVILGLISVCFTYSRPYSYQMAEQIALEISKKLGNDTKLEPNANIAMEGWYYDGEFKRVEVAPTHPFYG